LGLLQQKRGKNEEKWKSGKVKKWKAAPEFVSEFKRSVAVRGYLVYAFGLQARLEKGGKHH